MSINSFNELNEVAVCNKCLDNFKALNLLNHVGKWHDPVE